MYYANINRFANAENRNGFSYIYAFAKANWFMKSEIFFKNRRKYEINPLFIS